MVPCRAKRLLLLCALLVLPGAMWFGAAQRAFSSSECNHQEAYDAECNIGDYSTCEQISNDDCELPETRGKYPSKNTYTCIASGSGRICVDDLNVPCYAIYKCIVRDGFCAKVLPGTTVNRMKKKNLPCPNHGT